MKEESPVRATQPGILQIGNVEFGRVMLVFLEMIVADAATIFRHLVEVRVDIKVAQ